MKNKFLTILAFMLIVLLAGCNKYEEDRSKNTNLYGTYSYTINAANTEYYTNEQYVLSKDNTYKFTATENINGKNTKDYSKEGHITSIEQISEDTSELTLDKTDILYKYKNMLGDLYKAQIPDGKTFELKTNSSPFWFDKDGQYHICSKLSECDCTISCPQYTRKGNIIYFQSDDQNTYSIGFYVLDEGLFAPKLHKMSE